MRAAHDDREERVEAERRLRMIAAAHREVPRVTLLRELEVETGIPAREQPAHRDVPQRARLRPHDEEVGERRRRKHRERRNNGVDPTLTRHLGLRHRPMRS